MEARQEDGRDGVEMEATESEEETGQIAGGEVSNPHLPECRESMIPDFHNERWICICAPLRACEQRVREEWYEAQSETWDQGYVYGLDKAESAVMAVRPRYESAREMKAYAIAAIRVLKEKNND